MLQRSIAFLPGLRPCTFAALVELTHDDLCEIAGALAQVAVQGERNPERLQRLAGR